ncbi:GNAT family protein [Actinopolymorpha sp. B17G11]|uniref:GNAT family N-acetyltransferase n=1 Tax=Actinopolymorpha sp. B17G11 TaxID=3160861 RepID=UPI0032E3EBF2
MASVWVGERVRLRGGEPEEWEQLAVEFEQDSTVMRNAGALHPPRSRASYRQWAESTNKLRDDDAFSLVIESLPEERPVGWLGTTDVDKNAGVFSYGITIGGEYQRRGYASGAIGLVLRYMFGERRFQKCDVDMYAYNTASLRLHKKLGFIEEGRRRRRQFFAGAYHELVLMGMTVEEYAAHHSPGYVESTGPN